MKQSIRFREWNAVSDYLDNGFWQPTPSWVEHVIQNQSSYPIDAFTKGQLASKSWLLEQLIKVLPVRVQRPPVVCLFGCWIGTIVEPLHKILTLERIYGLDIDAEAVELSEKLNNKYVEDSWKYKGVVADVSKLSTSNMEFETGGELITVKPDWVINTSCEHMNNNWFDTADRDQLIIMQTNNSENFEGHVNTCSSIEDMQSKYPLRNVKYIGEMITPAYTRYMQIGNK